MRNVLVNKNKKICVGGKPGSIHRCASGGYFNELQKQYNEVKVGIEA